jgi:2-polyprenyl-3-methyl-5-hydroxy-6-metoxy-1,4-benzoquinol methylase
MKISEGLQEGGIVVGNAYDKYGSKNPVVRWIMKGFADTLSGLVAQVAPRTIHEVGCGEGYWVLDWNQRGIEARGSDFSEKVIDLARENAQHRNFPPSIFSARSIYDIEPGRDSADLVVCCEVLEHLENPEDGLIALQRAATDHVILSVPREPLWCALNLARGKYFRNFGNTPGHIQHWSPKKFIGLVGCYFEILEIKKPLPWTMVLCRVRR